MLTPSFTSIGRRVFGLCALFSFALQAQSPELAGKSRRGKELMAAGRYADAVPVYRELVQAVPGNPGLLLNLGMAYHMAGQDRDAIREFARVLKLQPAAYPALMMSAVSHMRLGEPAAAIPLFGRALAINPKEAEARSMIADALLMTGQTARAIPHLKIITAASPQNARAWYGLGRAYEQVAQESYEKLLKAAPNSPYTIALLGEARLRQGKLNSAFALFKQAGDLPGVHTGLAEVYEKSGHSDWAATERMREKSLPLPRATKPGTPEALFHTVRTNNQLALNAFQKLSALPESAELHELLGEMYRNQGKYMESMTAWDRARELAPQDDTRLKREYAATVYLSRDYGWAMALLREAVEREPNAADLQFMLGDALLNQQETEQAVEHLRKAVELDPAFLPAHAALGRAYGQLGKLAEAAPHLEKALPTDTDGALHYQLSRALQAAGQTERAQKMLARYKELQAEAQEPEPPAITAP